MRVAVTGGRGRWAPVVVEGLSRAGYAAVSFSRKAGEGHQALASLLDGDTLSKFDAILHFAWGTVPKTSETRPGSEWKGDLPFLSRLLQSIGSLSAERRPHLVFPSTGAVYGDCADREATEEDLPRPKSYYASAKLAAEDLLRAHEFHGISPVTILRITNLYGRPDAGSRPQGLIARLHACCRENRQPEIWGDGQATKDFLHENDFLRALTICLEKKLTGLWNLSSGRPVSLRELLRICAFAWGWTPSCHHLPPPPWDVHHTAISSDRIFRACGWRARVNLEEGIHGMRPLWPVGSATPCPKLSSSERESPKARI